MTDFAPSTIYSGVIIIDNRMDDVSIILGRPTNEFQAEVMKDPLWGDNPTYEIPSNSGEAEFRYALKTGIFYNAAQDRIQVPLTLSKQNVPPVSGMITIMTAGGETNPTSVIAQLTIGGQTTNQSISVSSLAAVEFNVDLDDINLIFTNAGQMSTSVGDSGIFEQALEVGIKMVAE